MSQVLFHEGLQLLLTVLTADGASKQMLRDLTAVWLHGHPKDAPLDAALAPLLLKGLGVGDEVSEVCRATALLATESLAVAYADRVSPRANTIVMAVLLLHAFGVMLGSDDSSARAAQFLERCAIFPFHSFDLCTKCKYIRSISLSIL